MKHWILTHCTQTTLLTLSHFGTLDSHTLDIEKLHIYTLDSDTLDTDILDTDTLDTEMLTLTHQILETDTLTH